MKLVKPVLAGFVVTSLLGASTISVSASAITESLGRVTFSAPDDNGTTDPINPIDPEEPGQPEGPGGEDGDLGPGEPGTSGPLRIDYVSNFDFGTIEFNGVDDVSVSAKPETWGNNGNTTNIPNFVQVTDERGENSGWELTVTQEGSFKTENDRELKAASITLSNIQAKSLNDSQDPEYASEVTLVPGDSESIAVADPTDPTEISEAIGVGTSIIQFGDTETMGKSVQLNVPGGVTVEKEEAYTTTLVWTLHNTPQS